MKIKALMLSQLTRPRIFKREPLVMMEPKIIYPVKRIEVTRLGLSTGKFIRVRIGGRRRKINIYYKEN